MGETNEDKVNVEGSNSTEKISFEFDKMDFREGLWNKIRYGSENYPYEQMALELMAKHNEFYGELNKVEDEYALRGAVLSCTHGNRYIRLDMCQDHGVYSQGIPVMTCNDYKIDENIFSFGLCGNSQYEPVYSETAPPPAETGVDKDGNVRHICCPILLEKWGYGIGSSRFNNEGVFYVRESNMPSECLTEMQHGDEQGEEYAEALTTRDNLICLYSGVITIEENPKPEEEMIVEEDPEPEEEAVAKENEREEEIYVRTCSEKFKYFLKSYETGGVRPTLADDLKALKDGMPATSMYYDSENNPTIAWGHKIEGNGEYIFSNGTTKNLYQEVITLDEAEEMLDNDINIKQTSLNEVLKFPTTQREYDMLLSMTFNAGTGLLTNSENPQTKRWFDTGGYKDIEYSKFVLGDITSGGSKGAKNRKADELEILMGIDYDKNTDDYDRIKSENGESIWNRPDKINELAEIWEDSTEYKEGEADSGDS